MLSQEHANTHDDADLQLKVGETFELWTKMSKDDSDRYNKINHRLESILKGSKGCVDDLANLLQLLSKLTSSQTDGIYEICSALEIQWRLALKSERDTAFLKLKAVQSEVLDLKDDKLNLSAQVAGLEDDKRALLVQIGQMVPRSDLSAAQLEAAARADDIRSLERDAAQQRDLIESLRSRLRDMEAANFELVTQMQVREH
jgi:predicted  nucleic acid-binding Zn-ribbon protein